MGAGELPLNYLAYYHGMYPNLGGGTMSGLEHGGFVLIAISLRDSGISIYELKNGTFRNSSMSTMGNSFGFNRDRTNQDLYLGKSIIDTMETDIGGWDFLFTYFKGEMDDLIIYDRVLKDEEIMHLFNLIGKYN